MFTSSEIEKLKENPYVENVTPREVVYGEVFLREYHRLIHEGHTKYTCFEILGMDPQIVGKRRISQYHYRYKQRVEAGKLLPPQDPNYQSFTDELVELRHAKKLLSQENEFLKKKRHLLYQRQRETGRNHTHSD